MFTATFLGHHCWLFDTGGARILVDPLLHPQFGFTDAVGLQVYPPRVIDLAAFPPIHAVVLTHEHEGHFDIPSLNALDRRIPIYPSRGSSVALRRFLEEMGFPVHPLVPGRPLTVGNLELHPMAADQNNARIEEWDSLAYLVRDIAGDGSFFTNVDMLETKTMRQYTRAQVKRPGLWGYTNNHSSLHYTDNCIFPSSGALCQTVRYFLERLEDLSEGWAEPEALLVTGGGFSFGGEQTWLNRNAFLFEGRQIADALTTLFPSLRVLAQVPGQCFVMEGGSLVRVEERTAFVSALPLEAWPSRAFVGDVPWLETYTPACGRTELSDEELEPLMGELAGFAEHLYAGPHFRALYSLAESDFKGRKPTFAFSLLADEEGGAYTFEYEPQSCFFIPVEEAAPFETYLAVYECWATDLLAYFRGELSSTTLSFGRSRLWNATPEAAYFDLNHALFEYVHPLRHPQRFLELYRRVLAAVDDDGCRIPYAES